MENQQEQQPEVSVELMELREAVAFAYDLQKLRIQQGNRAGSQARHAPAQLDDEKHKKYLGEASDALKDLEKKSFKELGRLLKKHKIYTDWLKDQKGVGPAMAAIIIANIDIEKAHTVSNIWSYCGLSVMDVEEELHVPIQSITQTGCVEITNADAYDIDGFTKMYKEKGIRKPFKAEKVDGTFVITDQQQSLDFAILKMLHKEGLDTGLDYTKIPVLANVKMASHRRKGQKANYNPFLKAKMTEILGGSFLKSNSPYREFYDNYKNRKSNCTVDICPVCKGKGVYGPSKTKCYSKACDGGKNQGPFPWAKSDAHLHRASIRYMVKMFFKDLYVQWRTMDGLPVRKPYEEEYLGMSSHASRHPESIDEMILNDIDKGINESE